MKRAPERGREAYRRPPPSQQGRSSSQASLKTSAVKDRDSKPPPAVILDYWQEKRQATVGFLEWRWFDVIIGAFIVFNAATIGIEQSLELEGMDTTWVQVLESVFLVVYLAELSMRFFAYRAECLRSGWVRFDAFLVAMGILTSWIVDPFVSDTDSGGLGPLMLLRVLRTARLLRLAKTARILVNVKECWMLLRGFLNSAGVMFYTFVVVFVTLYVFSCLGIELISKHRLNATDIDFEAHVQKHFKTLGTTMFTLVRFVYLDNCAEVYKPLVDKDPWLSLYFLTMILILSIVLFHLLGAVMFCSTLDRDIDDQDKEKRLQEEVWANLILNLREMFERLDIDNSGTLSRNEVLNLEPDDLEKLCAMLEVRTPIQVFSALDIDKSGAVSINEFFDGMWDMALQKGDVELKRMEKQVETMHWRLKETFSQQHDLCLQVDKILSEVKSFNSHNWKDTGGESGSDLQNLMARAEVPPKELVERLQQIWQESLQAALEGTRRSLQASVKGGQSPLRAASQAQVQKAPTTAEDGTPRRTSVRKQTSTAAAGDSAKAQSPATQPEELARRPSRDRQRTPSKTAPPALAPAVTARPQAL